MRPKEKKGGSQAAPNSRWVINHKLAHLSLLCPEIPEDIKWPKAPKKLNLGQGPKAPTIAMASKDHQRTPATFNKGFPLNIRETSGPTQWTQVSRNQEWCIYGIIYHYVPFFLSGAMLKISVLHYSISNQVPNSITNFEGRLHLLSLIIHRSYQKTIQGPQLLAFQVLVITFQQYSPKAILAHDSSRAISRVC
ncbi:hypothetical protein O181_036716 [Austropuccinia psidii MF-1]|uniref:Uncharacterized protein n=1 Tax=Austropuccinia psidii MF-1 TaxID=1389203 RepID=A0A9Q3DAQ2_9BASI|nr:hypothetical protein [Austropuccinia psidii MF-1]